MMLAQRSATTAGRPSLARRSQAAPAGSRRQVKAQANLFVELLASGTAGAAATAVTLITAEDTDKEIERIKTVEGALPLAAALGADTIAHSIPGLSVLFSLVSEPAGAAAGVAYMMSLVLSSTAVDPNTLAPKGTVVNAEKAQDSRGNVRVPFTQIVPTALNVIDWENDGSSGAGWTIGENGLPKLPVTSVLAVVGVGTVILEAASHAPLLGLFMPRVLQVAGWMAAAGYLLDKRETKASSSSSSS